ncbi:E3 ubiquitin-protein ligase RNF138 [Hoplias malabaricus]|uniref:E3 ubiquitin-protein ligase RNF138 n=1 Tax=Hoplias malabaricus TaxID=27720 RepID=UPI0034621830
MDEFLKEDECPVCKDTIQNPSEPSPCCRKVFCQPCLTHSIRIRHHCPYCRTPVPGLTVRNQRFRLPGLSADDSFGAARPVGTSIQVLLNQLRDASLQTQALQVTLPSGIGPANQAAPTPAAQAALPPQRRPIPGIRVRRATVITPTTPVFSAINPNSYITRSPAPVASSANSTPSIIPNTSSDELDEMAWRTEIELMESTWTQFPRPAEQTFRCPYCQQDGLDDLSLRDHCNANHLSDTRRVVCPVCVSLPHGDPLYHSRDFIGHLNLRHCYYIRNITNIHQSDDVNLQAAILMSLAKDN